jgi:hypothetical protein
MFALGQRNAARSDDDQHVDRPVTAQP